MCVFVCVSLFVCVSVCVCALNLNIVITSISLVTVINYSGNEGLNNQ